MKRMKYVFASICLLALSACAGNANKSSASEVKKVSAKGMNGDVVLNVTVAEGKVTAVEVVEHHETPDIGTKAIEQMPEKFVKAGNADVDAVAGATVTSQAMIEAVKEALK